MIVSDVNDKPRMLKEMMSSLQWMYWSQVVTRYKMLIKARVARDLIQMVIFRRYLFDLRPSRVRCWSVHKNIGR